jgi:D-beta-D-heptose 7-phosphate kinase/D-beta-D-heptose 1-phosphate adenosyltransferase
VLVKGSDYRKDQVVGADLVEGRGGRVVLIPLIPDRSTTLIVERIRASR